METTNKSPLSTSLKYGIILGLINCASSLIFYIMGMELSKIPQYMGMAIGILMIVLGIKAHRDNDKSYLCYIPRALTYLRDISAVYPAFKDFNAFITEHALEVV